MCPRNKARGRRLLVAGLIGAAAGGIAFAQRAPESLLPPGFGEPVQAPPAAPPASSPEGPTNLLPPSVAAPSAEEPAGEADNTADAEESPKKAESLEIPPAARRSLARVGVIEPPYGLAPDAFGTADGRFLTTLLHRLDAPIASRWASILLRRALLSSVDAPRAVAPVDWVAERAWLLVRMGEADAARMLVQRVDVVDFDPSLYRVATQVALATSDPAALCPLVPGAMAFSKEPAWPLAAGMCAALSGEAAASDVLLERARRQRLARGIDLLLAQKVAGAGTGGRRSIAIEWDGVDRLTAWRYGLATALAVKIPDSLYETVGPQVQAWRARAAEIAPADRVPSARIAAALGVFSNAALVDLYSQVGDATDEADIADSDAGRLRVAYVGADTDARMGALRLLWNSARGERDRYAAAILTARAAARIAPDSALSSDAAALVGAMLSAGLDRQAARWGGIVDAMSGSAGDRAWAMLAVGAPAPAVDLRAGRVEDFQSRAGEAGMHKSRLLVAALAGLGRLAPRDAARLAKTVGLPLGVEDRWSRALDEAARTRQPGTVALLCAVAMQTPTWGGVPAQHFYHMMRALRAVGLEPEARMMAAEAMTRL